MQLERIAPVWKSLVKSGPYQALNMPRLYVTTYYRSYLNRTLFRDVTTYCMFVGHARSGGSLVGALLDAHPNVILADEVDALRFVSAGFSKEQIYSLLLQRSRKQARRGRTKAGRDGTAYCYFVPGQWHGRFARLQVIGDSKAGISTQRLGADSSLFDRLRRTMDGAEVKVIHVVRNPYDTISTMTLRSGRAFEDAIEHYFANCETIARLQARLGSSGILTVKNDELIARPERYLKAICGFLGVEVDDSYLDACAGILYKSPAKSRRRVTWSHELVDAVERKIGGFDFLRDYSYDDRGD